MGNTLFLRKVGNFYHAFDEDAIVLFSLFHYRINNGKSGFPKDSLPKITARLREEKISYRIKVSEEEEEIEDFQEENQYQEIYQKGEKEYRLFHKQEKIAEKLFSFEEEKVDQVLNFVKSLIET